MPFVSFAGIWGTTGLLLKAANDVPLDVEVICAITIAHPPATALEVCVAIILAIAGFLVTRAIRCGTGQTGTLPEFIGVVL